MEKFGLNRGIEKSVAKHQDIKSFYSSIEDVKYIAQETKEDFKNDLKVKINIKTPEPTGKIFKTISQEDAKKSTIENLQEYKKKVELEQKRKEELAKRPKGESSLNEQHKNQSRPEPEEPQYSRPRPRF